MATRHLLESLAPACAERAGRPLRIVSVGGVEAARRVRAGERFDVIVLAADVVDQLIDEGHATAGSRTDLVRSAVAVAVRRGASRPRVDSEASLRDAVLAARAIGCSTGPSGVALQRLFERWALVDAIRDRLVQAPPGVPVAELLAGGQVDLGFQQLGELMHVDGVDVLGTMPAGLEIVTTFAAGVGALSRQPDRAGAVLEFLASPAADAAKRRHGMQPA